MPVLPEFAIEADAGRLTASFPTHPTLDDAPWANSFLISRRPDLPAPRILTRTGGTGSPWTLADLDDVSCPACGDPMYPNVHFGCSHCGSCEREDEC